MCLKPPLKNTSNSAITEHYNGPQPNGPMKFNPLDTATIMIKKDTI